MSAGKYFTKANLDDIVRLLDEFSEVRHETHSRDELPDRFKERFYAGDIQQRRIDEQNFDRLYALSREQKGALIASIENAYLDALRCCELRTTEPSARKHSKKEIPAKAGRPRKDHLRQLAYNLVVAWESAGLKPDCKRKSALGRIAGILFAKFNVSDPRDYMEEALRRVLGADWDLPNGIGEEEARAMREAMNSDDDDSD